MAVVEEAGRHSEISEYLPFYGNSLEPAIWQTSLRFPGSTAGWGLSRTAALSGFSRPRPAMTVEH